MIAGLILAAGESYRMGRDKALLAFRGSTFLEHIIATLHEADVKRVVVVLGHHAEEIQRAVNLMGVEVVVNPDYRRGQTSSLQAGLRALERPKVRAAILCLVDHPEVSAATMGELIAAYRASHRPVIIPTHQGRRGHPVIFGQGLFEELRALPPDKGATSVIHKYRPATQFVEVDDPGILLDVDDPASYRQLT